MGADPDTLALVERLTAHAQALMYGKILLTIEVELSVHGGHITGGDVTALLPKLRVADLRRKRSLVDGS